MILEIKYPCGLEIRYDAYFGLRLEFDFGEGCPIHKHNCCSKQKK